MNFGRVRDLQAIGVIIGLFLIVAGEFTKSAPVSTAAATDPDQEPLLQDEANDDVAPRTKMLHSVNSVEYE